MLVLVSFGLVLVATILLVVGLTEDALELIFLSIACSATAAIVLAVAFRRARSEAEASSTPPEPIPPDDEAPDAPLVAAEPALAAPATGAEEPTAVDDVVADPAAEGAERVNPGATPTADTAPVTSAVDDRVRDDDGDDGDDGPVVPIADR